MPKFEQFLMPDAGEGLTEADIVNWHVKVGDTVALNDPIVEIETAKSLVELPSPYAGVVTELLAEVGQSVNVGQPIITIDTDPNGAPGSAVAGQPATVATVPSAGKQPEVDDEPKPAVLIGYGVPAEGAPVRRRKANAAQGAPALTQSAPPTSGRAPHHTTSAAPAVAAPASDSLVLAKPPVRKLAKDLGVDLTSVVGTGPGGIITRDDVLSYVKQAQGQELATYPNDDQPWLASGVVSSDGRRTRVPVKSVRKRTAEAMVASAFTAPHVTVFQTVDVTKTMKLVEQLRGDKEFADVRVTPLLITAKALLIAVNRHPEINASWDDEAQEIVYKHYVNLGIAAATPRGLLVPNIKDAHRLSLKALAQGIANLTSQARAGKTSPKELSDGTVTITNVGVFGIDTGTPILNPGESAILAFGAIRQQPWVHKNKIKKRFVTQLALSFDHRLVDGELGARVLSDVAAVLENPAKALVWG